MDLAILYKFFFDLPFSEIRVLLIYYLTYSKFNININSNLGILMTPQTYRFCNFFTKVPQNEDPLCPSSLILVNDASEYKKAKGVNKIFFLKIIHNEYKDVLLNKNCIRHSMNRVQNKIIELELME